MPSGMPPPGGQGPAEEGADPSAAKLRALTREAEALAELKSRVQAQLHQLQVDEAELKERLRRLTGTGPEEELNPALDDDSEEEDDEDAEMGLLAAELELQLEQDPSGQLSAELDMPGDALEVKEQQEDAGGAPGAPSPR